MTFFVPPEYVGSNMTAVAASCPAGCSAEIPLRPLGDGRRESQQASQQRPCRSAFTYSSWRNIDALTTVIDNLLDPTDCYR